MNSIRSAMIAALLLPASLAMAPAASGRQGAAPIDPKEVDALLEPIRERHGLPALAGAIVARDGPMAVGAVGLRRAKVGPPVTADDRFHIGSDSKAMTATLLATFVEEGLLSWDSTLAEALPDLLGEMHPDYRSATVRQLLAHRAGFSGETAAPGLSLGAMRVMPGPIDEQRTAYLRRILAEPPASPPGSEFLYSNRNYIVAGAIAERLGGASWEDLMRARVFGPLGMETAGFGWMASPGEADQPWPHREGCDGPIPVPPGPAADNPLLIGPAGTVHVSMADWSRYVSCLLRGGHGEPALLAPGTLGPMLARPDEGDYAFGWGFLDREWGGGTVLTHAGSNTLNYAVVWMAPERGFAVLAATNQGGDAARQACDDVSGALIGLYLSKAASDAP